jgi:hypothetical protein
MREVQLYLGDDRVELFGGDNISITDSIRNAKDIAKVFTTFSTQFTVPASKVNNRIFKHYYNYNIDDTYTFDGRQKSAGRIELDNLPFKDGRISLDGVDLRNNKPYAYRITFYGSTVDLKDVLREDKLPSLTSDKYEPYVSLDIDKPYDAAAVKTALTSADDADGTHVPLMAVGQSLYYNSNEDSEQSGNLHYNASVNQGVRSTQLKYAVKLTKIIEAIESKYSQISFNTESFFKAADSYAFNQLYMWCHRKKGEDTVEAGDPVQVTFADDTSNSFFYTDDNKFYVDTPYFTEIDIVLAPAANGNRYNVIVNKNGSPYVRLDNRTAATAIDVTEDAAFEDYFEVFVETYENDVVFSSIEWDFSYREDSDPESPVLNDTISASKLTYDASFLFNIAKNLPDMKVIDFLSSLFKMFNLVAYVQTDGEIQVQTLDEFYSSEEIDISAYVDVEKSQVNVALPYKEISFKYKDSKTILAQQHYQEIAEVDADGRGPFEWGAVEYTDTDPDTLSGGSYKIEPDFHHMKFERIVDRYNGQDVGVQWGYFVDDNQETYLGSPVIFYSGTINSGTDISFLTPSGPLNVSGSQSVRFPSNFRQIDVTTSENIHFNPEISEYTKELGEETLFKQFYKGYIENIFNKKTRMIKISSVLPTRILTKLTLADIVVINGEKYRINSYSANINTGRTELELINKYD